MNLRFHGALEVDETLTPLLIVLCGHLLCLDTKFLGLIAQLMCFVAHVCDALLDHVAHSSCTRGCLVAGTFVSVAALSFIVSWRLSTIAFSFLVMREVSLTRIYCKLNATADYTE